MSAAEFLPDGAILGPLPTDQPPHLAIFDPTRATVRPLPCEPPPGSDVLQEGATGAPSPRTLTPPPEPSPPPPTRFVSSPMSPSSGGGGLVIFADMLDDMEKARIAAMNRVGALERGFAEAMGEPKGSMIPTPESQKLRGLVDGIAALEHLAEIDLKQEMRGHLLGPWVKRTIGIGEKQGARLIAAIGDPAWNTLHNRPRTVSELWAYCGLHVIPGDRDSLDTPVACVPGVAPKRRKGQKANWSTVARSRAYVCAESCIRAGIRKLDTCDDSKGYDIDGRKAISPLGAVYLSGRSKYADATVNGEPISDGHQHARAMRLVMKEILKDLWRESQP